MTDKSNNQIQPRVGTKISFLNEVITPDDRHRPDPKTEREAVEDARRLGFSTRAEPVKVDGRKVRRTDRNIQLNMKLSAEVRDSFYEHLQDFLARDKKRTTQDFVEYLLALYAKKAKSG
jgi:hypothetical protein